MSSEPGEGYLWQFSEQAAEKGEIAMLSPVWPSFASGLGMTDAKTLFRQPVSGKMGQICKRKANMLRRIHLLWRLAVLLAVLATFGFPLSQPLRAQSDLTPEYEARHDIVPFVPTPMKVAERMLEIARVTSNDVVYDLGSGDGRIVILAAQKYGARAVGVELDGKRYKESSAKIEELGLASKAKILHGDMFKADIHPATVVTLYLLTSVNADIRPMLEKQLRPGTRVVSHDFQMTAWTPQKTEEITDENGSVHTVYLYIKQGGRSE